ncbi:MAG TPA: glycoside hydrolase family 3 C-terminal domain-containing protein [Propionibacteriaceae bacterium]|nr:glycoside hydrolase family 3 C-terminal domain-containing protein [Propionibacteriaceae bacterium]
MTQTQSVDHEAEIAGRLAQLSLEQKIRLMTGADIWALHAIPEIGLRRLVTSDGPAGVRGETWDERSPSANVPSPTALAASWDPVRVERMGRLLASEARRKGVDVLLAPTVNLHRTPYGGRHFECFSEDPELTAMIGTAYVQGLQAEGVAATVKHFVANDSETDRFSVDALVDERVLRELYLAPFERIVAAGAWAIMAAYNRVNGTTMTENPLQRDVLKREWAFDGVIMSDWYATRSVAAAGEDLLDLAMPGPESPWTEWLLDEVQSGKISESAIDGHVLRILRLAARVGALDGLAAATPPARRWSDQELSAELRATSAAGMVLIKNDGLLPLDTSSLKQVALIGPNAATARTLGGGSATVFPPYVVSPLDGLRAALGAEITIVPAVGVRSSERADVASKDLLQLPDGSGPGVEVIFFDASDRELGRQQRQAGSMMWWGPVQEGVNANEIDHLQLSTRLRVAESGRYRVGTSGLGDFRLIIDGETLFDETITLPLDADMVEGIMKPPQQLAVVELEGGRDVPVELTYRTSGGETMLGGAEVAMLTVQLNVEPVSDEQSEFDHAVSLAAESDVAVVVVGTNEEVESEGFDRTSLALPGRQDELVSAVAAINPRTVVVVNSGAPVLLPWADDVAAVLVSWFPGQEFGNALADVLTGAVEPGGRLPVTWLASDEGLPPVTPVNGELPYDEGLLIGYRWYLATDRTPAFPFGYGLGYTTWAYEDMAVNGNTVTVTVRNSGARGGREVVQVYASRADSRVRRAPRWLVGSAAVDVAPGEVAQAVITLGDHSFRNWDSSAHAWMTEPGAYQLHAGRSVNDTPLSAELTPL